MSFFKVYGTDKLYGQANKPLKKFRGKFAWKHSIDTKLNEEQSIRDAKKIANRNRRLSVIGLKGFK